MSETAAAKKASARKTTAKKAAKKSTAKKSTAKRASARAAAAPTKSARKASAKKTGAKKSGAKKSGAKKTSAKKTSAKKTSAKKTSAGAGRPRDAEALEDLAAKAEAGAGRDDRFAQFMDDIGTLARLTVAYARGEYRDLPADKLAMVVAGLLYVASPWGLLPRLLGGLGLSQVLRSLHDDLDAFRAWEAGRG